MPIRMEGFQIRSNQGEMGNTEKTGRADAFINEMQMSEKERSRGIFVAKFGLNVPRKVVRDFVTVVIPHHDVVGIPMIHDVSVDRFRDLKNLINARSLAFVIPACFVSRYSNIPIEK